MIVEQTGKSIKIHLHNYVKEVVTKYSDCPIIFRSVTPAQTFEPLTLTLSGRPPSQSFGCSLLPRPLAGAHSIIIIYSE